MSEQSEKQKQPVWAVGSSQQVEKFLNAQFCLFDDVHEKGFVDLFTAMDWDNRLAFLCRMPQNDMTAFLAVLHKTSLFERSNNFASP